MPEDNKNQPVDGESQSENAERSHRVTIIAAVIGGVATIVAAVVAAVITAGGSSGADESPATPPAAPAASPTVSESVQTLPVDSPTPEPSPTAARIIASPDSAAPGTVVTITGSGFSSGEQVRLTFRGTISPDIDVRDVTAGSDGGFVAEAKVPEDVDSSVQQWEIVARGLDSGRRADTPFQSAE